ncbi:MAG: hypothetical protein OEY64_04515 [Nitrospinota bacterium]|nr:hypothetical protein [Nitrospinota bacterium]
MERPLILTVSAGFILSLFQIVSYDVWWHIASGRWMVENLGFPFKDPFSFTTAGAKWVFHNWLFDLPLFAVHQISGVDGLVVFRAILVALFSASLYFLFRLKVPAWQSALLAIAVIASLRLRFFLRPILASDILFVLVLFQLVRLYGRERLSMSVRDLYKVPLLIFFWSNLHAGVVFGLITAGTFLLSSIVERRNWKPFAALFGASFIAGLVNPNHIHIYLYSFRYLLFKKEVAFLNAEHAPPPLPWELPQLTIYWLVIFAAMVLIFARARKAPPYAVMLVAGFGYLGLTSFRGMEPFCIVSLFTVVTLWQNRIENIRLKQVVYLAIMAIVSIAAVYSQPLDTGRGIAMDRIPVSAVDFIEKVPMEGEMFNSHPFGGYLIYRLYPSRKVFIDGRDLLHANTIRRLEDFGYAKMLDLYKVEWVIAGYRDAVLKNLPMEEWSVVYFDDISVILARRGGRNSGVIEKYGYRQITPFNLEEKVSASSGAEREEVKNELERAVNSSRQTSGLGTYLERLR